jgi:uncharacterized lipoprotein YajG
MPYMIRTAQKLSLASLLVCAALLSGCATQSFSIAEAPPKPTVEKRQTFFLGGILQEKSIDAAKTCGGADKVAKVERQETFVDGLLGVVTLGIYTPLTARVYCL